MLFDPKQSNQSIQPIIFNMISYIIHFPAVMIEHVPLEEVFIFFDTATYDEIERDVKVKLCVCTVYVCGGVFNGIITPL